MRTQKTRPRSIAPRLGPLAAALLVLGAALRPAEAAAAAATASLTITASVAARATLTLGAAAITFPDSDPAAVPAIPASENPVTVDARVRTGAGITPSLTVLAAGDLASGADTIAISNVTWTAAAPFTGGTMDRTAAQSAAAFPGGSGVYSGTFSYFLANSWLYPVGTYTATVTYTLTAP